MSRWIIADGKTKTNIHNQLSYLESYISKQFHLNVKKNQHIPFQLKNGMQYLDPNPKKNNEIKLLSGNGETGVFYVTWKYTADQQKIFNLYRKLQTIPSEDSFKVKGRITDYDQPISLSIEQIRNIIKKEIPKITNDEKSMIKFFKKSCLKLYFNKLQDIFPEFCLFKNKARYSFKDDGALNPNMIQPPTIKVKWYNLPLMALVLKNEITKELDYDNHFEHFVTKEQNYADDWVFIYYVLYWLKRMVPELTDDFDDYFSLSHTELFVGITKPVTLYFNEGNKYDLGITWSRTIYIKGKS